MLFFLVARDDNKSKTGAYIGAGVSGGLVVITVLVVFTIIKKKILKSYVYFSY